MTNEAVIIELLGHNPGCPIQYTIADNTTGNDTAKGTLMELSGDRIVQASTTANAGFVGVTTMEKVGGDGSTTITVWTNGIFDMKSDAGTDLRGASMAISATENIIETGVDADMVNGSLVGYYLEDGTANGVEAVRVLK